MSSTGSISAAPIAHCALMMPVTVSLPFNMPGWVFELKYDGVRALVQVRNGEPQIRTRRGECIGDAFPELREELARLPDLVIDAELVVPDALGRPRYGSLSRRLQMSRQIAIAAAALQEPAALFAFDLLMLGGFDLRGQPLLGRKAMLEHVLRAGEHIHYVQHIAEQGEELYEHAFPLLLEGIVGKRVNSRYTAGRSGHWVAIRTPFGKERQRARIEGLSRAR
jgi:bifunctional non-homologous end joining protein LigD